MKNIETAVGHDDPLTAFPGTAHQMQQFVLGDDTALHFLVLEQRLAQLGDGDTKDLFRLLLERGMQDLIDAELTATIGARWFDYDDELERSDDEDSKVDSPDGDILTAGSGEVDPGGADLVRM